jgi:very-short-patch-repair endonuclease
MLSIGASKKRLAGVGVKRPKKKAKPKRPRGTKFINFTCELDKDNCVINNVLCIAHKTSEGNLKVKCLVNAKVATTESCGSHTNVEMECDVCFHVFSIGLNSVTSGIWCGMCSNKWEHCGVMTCTFCFERSIESYERLTSNGKKKADCTVNKDDLRLPMSSHKKVKFKCDVCLHVFSIGLNSVINGKWCGMCSNKWKHCGADTCTFCFNRSIESYERLTLNGKKKADCVVKKADLRLALGSRTKVEFECDVCFIPFSMRLDRVTSNGSWCPCSKNKTATKIFKFLLKMKFEVVREYIPGGKSGTTSLMKQTYGKNGFMDYHLPGVNILFELDGRQHNMEVAYFKTSLFTCMVLDKWKEFWAQKCGLSVIRFDQTAIWKNKYNWKQEMENILTFTSEQLTKQLKVTEKRYKKYAKQHQKASKRMDIPDHVKISHQIANTPSNEYITKYVLAMKPFGIRCGNETIR